MPTTTPPIPANTKVKISVAVLKRMCAVNQFAIPANVDIIFFGIRGATPEKNVYDKNFKYVTEANVILAEPNNKNFRCTIGQWLVKEDKIGLFIGSTVPGLKGIAEAMEDPKKGVNMLLTGFYTDYEKGNHSPRPQTTHKAFRQIDPHPVRRTRDDLQFEATDPIDFGIQHDNIHSAYTDNILGAPSASHGCQIILGVPKCAKFAADTSAWKIFREKAYSFTQAKIPYILLEGRDFLKYGIDLATKTNVRLRFGSSGEAVETLQKALIAKGATTLKVSKIFDIDTLKNLIELQKKAGKTEVDGIVGPITAAEFGITLPQV
jgi:hypothetical protein